MARYYQAERDRGSKKARLLYQLYNQNLIIPHNSKDSCCQIMSHSVAWSLTLKLAALEKSVTFLFGSAGSSICRIWVSPNKRAASWGRDGHFAVVVVVLSFLFVFHLLSFFFPFLFFSFLFLYEHIAGQGPTWLVRHWSLSPTPGEGPLDALLGQHAGLEGEALAAPRWVGHVLTVRQCPPCLASWALPVSSRCSWADWSAVVWSQNLLHCTCGMIFRVVITVCWPLWLPCFYWSSVAELGTGFCTLTL